MIPTRFLYKAIVSLLFIACTWGLLSFNSHAENPDQPTFRSYAGTFLSSDDHNFYIESELTLPIAHLESFRAKYRHRESTPFLELEVPQAELVYEINDLAVDITLTEDIRLLGTIGHHSTHQVDHTGLLDGHVVGIGLASSERHGGERIHGWLLAGPYISRRALDSDWWTDFYLFWRAIDFASDRYLESRFRGSLALSADIESSNTGNQFRALYKVGIELQIHTAVGNRANVGVHLYRNDNNPFYGVEELGTLLGLEVISSFEEEHMMRTRETRTTGWFPLVWGSYDLGVGSTRRISRFEMFIELVDIIIHEQPFTGVIGYEIRQEHRIGDFDNVEYTVHLGIQTPIGFSSPLAPGDPLIFGLDFLHRSDHAMNPNVSRTSVIGVPTAIGDEFQNLIAHSSLNVLPRFRLQTLGWDLPYRDPTMYEKKTKWLHLIDWRATTGVSINSSRKRGPVVAQLGANWDIGTIQGFVAYLRGIGSIGNETPDWQGEFGLRRPSGKAFARFESYHPEPTIAQGDTFVIGVGINL